MTSDEATDNTSINFWNPGSGSKMLSLRGPPAYLSSLSPISDEGFAVIETGKPFIHFWQAGYPLQTSRRILCPGKPCSVAVHPNGTYFAVAIEEKLSIWQVGSGRIVAAFNSAHFRPISCLKFNSNGSYLVSAGQDGMVNAWNFLQIVSGAVSSPTYVWSDHSLPVTGLKIDTGGHKANVYTSSLDRTCKIYSLATGTLLLSVSFPVPLTAVTVESGGRSMYLGGKSGAIYKIMLDSPPRSLEHHVLSDESADFLFKGHTSAITCLSLTADGKTLASGDEEGNIFAWDVTSQQCIRTIQKAQTSADGTNKVNRVTNIMFWMGDPESLKGAKKPTICFPEVPKLLEAQDDAENPVVRIWTRNRLDEDNRNLKDDSKSSLLAEISKLRVELAKNEVINRRLHQFCTENILGLQDDFQSTPKKRKSKQTDGQ